MSSRSSARRMNGSWLANSLGSTTNTAVCPGPAKPGAGGAGVTVRAMWRRTAVIDLIFLLYFVGPRGCATPRSLRDRGFRRRRPPSREVHDRAGDAEGEGRPGDPGCPQRAEAEQCVQREDPGAGQAECYGGGRDHQGELDPVRRHEEAIPPMHARRRDDHHRNDERRPDRAEEAERHEESAAELGEAPGPDPYLLKEPAGPRDPVPADPAEKLLRAVRREGEAEDQPYHQQPGAHREGVGGPRGKDLRRFHGISLLFSYHRSGASRACGAISGRFT